MKTFIKCFRVGRRCLLALGLFTSAYIDYGFRVWKRGKARSFSARAEWLQFWSVRLLRILNFQVRFEGVPPVRGMLVSNHLGYVDVLVFASIQKLVFVSKSEVASWPVAGPLTRCAGTLYIVRRDKTDVLRLARAMEPVINEGVVIALFPEGTSSDGSSILRFKSSLLAPAVDHQWPVTSAWIQYTVEEGSVENDICYWGDMTFIFHFLRLMSVTRTNALVRFGSPIVSSLNRKVLADELHSAVCKLKQQHGPDRSSVAV